MLKKEKKKKKSDVFLVRLNILLAVSLRLVGRKMP